MLYLFLSVAALSLAAWDMFRRWMAYDRAKLSGLSEKLTALIESNRISREAQLEFLKQMRELVKFTEEKKRSLEMSLAGKKL